METNDIKIGQILSTYDNIVLGTHVNPDGDAVSSTFAFAQTLKIMGKNPIVLISKYSDKYCYIKGAEFIYNGDYDNINPDVFIALDCGDKKRLGKSQPVFDRAKITFNIDHHISNNNFADNNIVLANASSSSEVVFEVIKNFSIINTDIAEAIYTGIISDTGGFKHNSTTAETHNIVAQLLKYNINFSEIHRKVLYDHTIEQIKIFTKALNNLEIDNKIAFTTITVQELKQCGADTTDLDGIVEYMLNIRGIEVSVFLYEKSDGSVKASLRSKNIDVNNIASKYGGGGHKAAAGASFDKNILQVKDIILNDIENELRTKNE